MRSYLEEGPQHTTEKFRPKRDSQKLQDQVPVQLAFAVVYSSTFQDYLWLGRVTWDSERLLRREADSTTSPSPG